MCSAWRQHIQVAQISCHMILSIECNGCKATLTSASNLTISERDNARIEKERRVAEASVFYKTFGERNGRKCNKSGKKKKSLSEYFEIGSSSSKNLSSDSSVNYYNKCSSSSNSTDKAKQITSVRPKSSRMDYRKCEVKVDRGIAVVEESSDPYGDFRRSMVEMIMARKKLRDGDLTRLLRSYLSLNPPQHHPVIIKAFTDLHIGGSVSA